MKSTVAMASIFLLAAVSSLSAYEQPCGGIIEGDTGDFQYAPVAADGNEARNCIWLIHAAGASKLLLTFNELAPTANNSVILYPELHPGQTCALPITVTAESIGSTFDLPGSTVLIILPQANSSISLTWDSDIVEASSSITTVTDYIETPTGKLSWSPRRNEERLYWILGFGQSADDVIEWNTKADFSDCDRNHPCSCLRFEVFGINDDGYLVEFAKICGASSAGSSQMQSYPLVIVASANSTKHGASGLELRWVNGDGQPVITSTTTATTTTTTSRPPPEAAAEIYFASGKGGIKAYSPLTSAVRTVVESAEILDAIAYDPLNSRIYYCNWASTGQIFRAAVDGSGVEALQSNVAFGFLRALAMDYRTGNLYVVYDSTLISVCNTASSNLTCTDLRGGNMSRYYGIALDSIRGEMFITGNDGVRRAQMDGSNYTAIDTGYNAMGITLDSDSDRLYWADYHSERIVSSFRDGTGLETVVQLDAGARPWGIITANGNMYWGNYYSYTLQQSLVNGEEVVTVYNGTDQIFHLTGVPSQGLNELRNENISNPCEGQGCSHICVLKGEESFRCLCPEGWSLAQDERTCTELNVHPLMNLVVPE